MGIVPKREGVQADVASERPNLLRAALEAAPLATAYLTSDAICEFANAELRALLHHRGRAPDRMPVELVFGPSTGADIRARLERSRVDGHRVDFTVAFPHLPLPAQVRIAPDPGAPASDGYFLTVLPEYVADSEAMSELRSMLEALGPAVALVDREFRLIRWNRSFAGLNLTPARLRPGLPLRPTLATLTARPTGPVAPESRSPGFDPRVGDEVGTEFRLKVPTTNRTYAGAAVAVGGERTVLTFVDTTESAAMHAELNRHERLRALGQLAGGVAHDFNNLLAVIVGNLDLIGVDLPASDAFELIEAAKHAALRGSALTGALLGFGRGRPGSGAGLTSVNDSVRALETILSRTLVGTVNVETELASWIPDVAVDAALLENALLNLALNAQEAMPEGGTLTLRTECLDPSGETAGWLSGESRSVVISVVDSGDGMTTDVRARAVEPFFSTKPAGVGAGLGLPSVQRFVDEAGGRLQIESTVGEGTTVRLSLPTAPDTESFSAAGSTDDVARGRGRHVLLVDDDRDVRNTFRSMLQHLDYCVTDVDSGELALELLAKPGPVDVLLADFRMAKGVAGPELVRQARALRPQVPAILISGHPDADAPTGTPLLLKPFRLTELAAALEGALGDEKQETPARRSGRRPPRVVR